MVQILFSLNDKIFIYNGKFLGNTYNAYSTINIVPTVVTINGKTYYKVAGKDEYVSVTNITGTQRTLCHNAYIYWYHTVVPQVQVKFIRVKL